MAQARQNLKVQIQLRIYLKQNFQHGSLKSHSKIIFFIQNIPSNTAMKCFEYLSISETFSTFFPKNAHKYPSNGDRLDTDPWSIKGKK